MTQAKLHVALQELVNAIDNAPQFAKGHINFWFSRELKQARAALSEQPTDENVGEQWANLAIAMLGELRMDYAPGTLPDTDGVKAIQQLRAKPVAMLLFCPRCAMQHVDAPEPDIGWTNPPHATHTCRGCGLLWRPSNANTVGVRELELVELKHLPRQGATNPAGHWAGGGYAVIDPSGNIVGAWRSLESAQRIVNRSEGAKGERIVRIRIFEGEA